MAFSTKSLTLDQWLWCLFFGVGTLIWGQLVTTVPTRKIPKILSWGRGHPEEYTEAIAIGEEKFDLDSDKKPRAGQILWIRGLTRLQTQLRVIRAFKSNLEDLEERRSVHSLHSLRSSRSHTGGPWPPRPLSDITYIDEDSTATKLSPQQKTGHADHPSSGKRLLSPHTLRPPAYNTQFTSPLTPANSEIPKPVHETRI